MIVSIAQPAYLPWLGYLDRIARSDLHVVLDHVPMDHSSRTKFANRNRVRTADGWCWLTVPVMTKGEARHLPLNELAIVNEAPWARKHWQTLQSSYGRAPGFAAYADQFRAAYDERWEKLVPLCRRLTGHLLTAFRIETRILWSSELSARGARDELLLAICAEVGATTYVSGPLGREYLREELFRDARIEVVYHEYVPAEYPQAFPGFEPYMSAVDLLFNAGADARSLLDAAPGVLVS